MNKLPEMQIDLDDIHGVICLLIKVYPEMDKCKYTPILLSPIKKLIKERENYKKTCDIYEKTIAKLATKLMQLEENQ